MITDMTHDERMSLASATNAKGTLVRLTFFAMKRCPDCTPRGRQFDSCNEHMISMAKIG